MSGEVGKVPPMACPECGAPVVDGLTCWERLGYLLAWEVDDQALAAAHFITVAAYNLQHPAPFNESALVALQAALVAYLDDGVAADDLRMGMAAKFEGAVRVLRPEAERKPTLRHWTVTIDHAFAGGDAAGATPRVRQWAEAVRQDMDEEG